MSALAPTLQSFFTERLARQRQASPRTIASYRDTFRLLLSFVERETGKAPSALDIEDLNGRVISAFLDHLEAERHNTPRTRNARLGHPLPVPLRRAAPSRARRTHRSGAGHPPEALRQGHRVVPHPSRA
jgi:hypothetical protein